MEDITAVLQNNFSIDTYCSKISTEENKIAMFYDDETTAFVAKIV